ncbi:PRTRC system protein E [Mycobacterium sp. Root135]|uniref:BtrH N-terminal domain-containing protein n=1 Tax=Mycobacterium sp. Root135 TaxID=1736457 RepID=UPI0006FA11A5|nr:BtrH N-terminal domain-containing protein [Mycobacterium sp. Root135]KQY10205.1 PRTRC system protein E [Mycobacterium sp. Root135]
MTTVQIPYRHEKGGHCGSGALRDLTEWAEIAWGSQTLEEGVVFALGGALDFCYVRSPQLTPQTYLVGRGSELEQDYLTRVGATFVVRTTDDPDVGWAFVTDEVDKGRPVMVWADIGELPYLRVRLHMSRHDIVIVGYDDEERVAYVVDNDRDTTQLVPYDKLRRARSSVGFPTPTRHTTYHVDWPDHVPDLRPIAGDALGASAAVMRGDAAGAPLLHVEAAEVESSGLKGVQAFAEDLRSWTTSFDDEGLTAALFGLGAFIEKAGTGGGLFRTLQAQGCQTIADLLNDAATADAAAAARDASNAWSALAAAATNADTPLRSRSLAAAEVAAMLPETETRLVGALERASRSLGASTPTSTIN